MKYPENNPSYHHWLNMPGSKPVKKVKEMTTEHLTPEDAKQIRQDFFDQLKDGYAQGLRKGIVAFDIELIQFAYERGRTDERAEK